MADNKKLQVKTPLEIKTGSSTTAALNTVDESGLNISVSDGSINLNSTTRANQGLAVNGLNINGKINNNEYNHGLLVPNTNSWEQTDKTIAVDEDVVHKANNETIVGSKLFTNTVSVSSGDTKEITVDNFIEISPTSISFYKEGLEYAWTFDGKTFYDNSESSRLNLPTLSSDEEATIAVDENVVHNTGTETIAGDKTFTNGLSSSGYIQITNSDGEYLSVSGTTLFRGKNSGPDSYIDIPRNKGTSSTHAILATTDDIEAISGAENFVQIGTSSSPVDQTIYGIKTFNDTVYSNGNFNTNNSGTYASYGARTIALGTNSSPGVILNLPTTSGTHTLALDDEVVHLANDETITGAKTLKGSNLTFTSGTYNWTTVQLVNDVSTPELKLIQGGGAGTTAEYTANNIKLSYSSGAGIGPFTLAFPQKTGTLTCLYKHYIWINYTEGTDDYEDYFSIISPIANSATTGTALVNLFDSALSIRFKGTMYGGNWESTANAQVLNWSSTQSGSTISLRAYWTVSNTGQLSGTAGSYSVPTGGGGGFNDSVTPIS